MKLPKPKLITFDAFGTLYTPKKGVVFQYARYMDKYHGIDLDQSKANQTFRSAFKSTVKKHPFYGKPEGIDVKQWWSYIVRPTLEESSHVEIPDAAVSGLYDYFAGAEPYELYSDVIEGLRECKSKGFNIGIVSNSDPRLRKVVEEFGLERFLYSHEAYSLSYEVDYEKPSKEIFKDAELRFSRCSNDSSDSMQHFWHVGDDLEKDFYGALEAGWNAVLMDRTGEYFDNLSPLLRGTDPSICEKPGIKIIGASPVRILCDGFGPLLRVF